MRMCRIFYTFALLLSVSAVPISAVHNNKRIRVPIIFENKIQDVLTSLVKDFSLFSSEDLLLFSPSEIYRTMLAHCANNGNLFTFYYMLHHSDDSQKEICTQLLEEMGYDLCESNRDELLIKASRGERYTLCIADAAKKNDYNRLRGLLKNKENREYINTPSAFGRTSIHWAVVHKNENMIKLLRNNGANCNNIDHNGLTSLHYALYFHGNDKKSVRIVKQLLKSKADVNAKGFFDCTPLTIAKINNQEKMIKLLSKHGAVESSAGKTLLQTATGFSNWNDKNIVLQLPVESVAKQ